MLSPIPSGRSVCKLIPFSASVKIPESKVATDPNLLFQRTFLQASHPDAPIQIEECLKFEFSPLPMSLYDDVGMRTGIKSDLAKLFVNDYRCKEKSADVLQVASCIIFDGGALLHHIPWSKNSVVGNLIESYVT